jgi:uncharacterized protein (DUF1015 family)
MADVRGLRGLYYNPARIPDASNVISLPYDVISPEHRQEYIQRSEFNIVRLILPDGADPYAEADRLAKEWIREGILIQDQEPCVYLYHQTFRTNEGEEKTRTGFLARVRLEDFDKGVVLPHEATLFAPKEDRLKLLRASKINFSAIFSLYSDPTHEIDSILQHFTSAPPRFSVADESGILNRVWAVRDVAAIQKVQEIMQNHWVLIADGHHRYESCLVYRDEQRKNNSDPEAPFNFTLMYFSNIHHPGIAISPYNRAVADLPSWNPQDILRKSEKYFDQERFDNRDRAVQAAKENSARTAFTALVRGIDGAVLFKLKPGVDLKSIYPKNTPEVVMNLDVNVLHKLFLNEILGITDDDVKKQTYIKYFKDLEEERRAFDSGKLQIAFFLNPTRVDQVVEAAKAGLKMPQKSTFFYPKIMTGFVMNKHE